MYLLLFREVRPVYNASHAVVVRVGITLTQIFDMVSDAREQVIREHSCDRNLC